LPVPVIWANCFGVVTVWINLKASGVQDSQIWKKSITDFQQDFTQLAALRGWVSQTEHSKFLKNAPPLKRK
jgi:hypothetical protein